tara:strand:+ start:1012 stop:1689 length:678 start_codon:yes stop_codon:yes gene_type:complete
MLSIIVPYRASHQPERLLHMLNFIQTMIHHLPSAYIYIVEQTDDRPFNRGALLNIGVHVAGMDAEDVICFHDVDLLPCADIVAEYLIPLPDKTVRHIGRAWKRYDSDTYLGGILLMRQCDFIDVNGYPNDFFGWGGEDDELRDRIQRAGLNIERNVYGTIIDQENLTLEQKLSHLKKTHQKCVDKWERRAWHRQHPGQHGFKQVKYEINKVNIYSPRCLHYFAAF